MRKMDIRNHIEDSFNWKDKSMPKGDQVKDKVNQLPGLIFPISTTVAPSPVSIDYTERVQSFFPECKKILLQFFLSLKTNFRQLQA